jgi:hypothetical protein
LLLTPHLMTPPATRNRVQRELNILVSGSFNAGLIACRPTPAVIAFVQWWAGRVQEWHGHDQAAGLYWDQKWLDFAPVHVPLTWIIRDPGINLGHWRLPEAPPVSQCRLLHLSGFRPEQPEQISRYTLHIDSGEVPAGYRELFIRYGQLLKHPGTLSVLGTSTSLPAATKNWRASPPAPPDDQSRIAFATAAAKSEWALVRTLWESFHHHHPDIPFFVLLTDEPDGFFDPDREPFEVLRLDDLALDGKAALARSMDRMEFTYALTPDLLLAIHRKGFGRACFLKQESLVVASMLDAANQLAGCSILLTPHLPAALTGETGFSREANILQSGIYNVGFIGVRDTQEGSRFLEWWRDRVHHSCRRNVQEGLHFEQRWLDLVPCYFEGVDFVRDKGFNIGHWNLPELSIDLRAGRFFHADGVCSFFRLSGFDYDQPAETSRYRRSLTLDRIGSAAEVFRAYRAGLSRHGYRNSRHWPWHFQASPGTPPRRWWRRLSSALRRSLCGPLPARFPSGMRFPAPLVRWRRRIKARRQ